MTPISDEISVDIPNKSIAKLESAHTKADSAEIDFLAFNTLQASEAAAVPLRRERLEAEVEVQVQRERALQQRFAELTAERDALHAARNTVVAPAVV